MSKSSHQVHQVAFGCHTSSCQEVSLTAEFSPEIWKALPLTVMESLLQKASMHDLFAHVAGQLLRKNDVME